mmetsp:Transcript_15771/g.40661  ORF Transcript_15771/g.40661 Transcript_15771/m.40661 type:complete len:223 (+) Transcript_15771:195-863(+)
MSRRSRPTPSLSPPLPWCSDPCPSASDGTARSRPSPSQRRPWSRPSTSLVRRRRRQRPRRSECSLGHAARTLRAPHLACRPSRCQSRTSPVAPLCQSPCLGRCLGFCRVIVAWMAAVEGPRALICAAPRVRLCLGIFVPLLVGLSCRLARWRCARRWLFAGLAAPLRGVGRGCDTKHQRNTSRCVPVCIVSWVCVCQRICACRSPVTAVPDCPRQLPRAESV